MEENMLNKILQEIISIKENQNTMSVQITDLAIGQNRLFEKIDNVRTELKTELRQEIESLRAELKTELRQEIEGLRTEFKSELKQESTSIREEIRQLREITEFTKDTCESIMRVCTHEFRKQDTRYKVLKLMIEETRAKYRNHEFRICKLEMKSKKNKAT